MRLLTLRGWALAGALILGTVAACAGLSGQAAAPGGPTAPAAFIGKFELVPLFNPGDTPVIRNGHQYYAVRNTFSLRRPNGEVVTIFAGERTDLGSIPRPLWGLLPPDGRYAKATVPHDACYRSKGSFEWYGHVGRTRAEPYARAECDQILDEGMVALHVPKVTRSIIYGAVRVGGGGGWGR